VQGYNAQAVVTEQQLVVAAELTQQANDVQQLHPILAAVDQTLHAAEIPDRPATVLADSGYWSIANLTTIPDAPELLVWPSKTGRTGKPRTDGQPSASKSDSLRAAMFAKLASEGQGVLRQAQADHRAGLRPAQGATGRATVQPLRPGRLPGGVEAGVRHPQPAQAVAPHPPPTSDQRYLNSSDRPYLSLRPASPAARARRRERPPTGQ
jgi:hypothetical protein